MAKDTEVGIVIPGIRLARATVRIKGETPLLTCRFTEEEQEKIEKKQQNLPTGNKAPRDPQEEFQAHIHWIDKEAGICGFPAAGIKKSLVTAGGRFTDEQMTVLRGVINVAGDLLEIKAPPPTMRTDMGKLQGKIASPIYRPQWFPWEIDVPVVYNANLMSREGVLELFQQAGFGVGIGSWRPECKGTMGQFSVEEVKA